MKLTIIYLKTILFFVIFLNSLIPAQEIKINGTFKRIETEDSTRSGVITIYQNSDSTALFYIDLCRGAPSYNLGNMIAEMKFVSKSEAIVDVDDYQYDGKGCKFTVSFNNEGLNIESVDSNDFCGFGFGVYPDGQYKLENPERPKYFIFDNHKILFDTLKVRNKHSY